MEKRLLALRPGAKARPLCGAALGKARAILESSSAVEFVEVTSVGTFPASRGFVTLSKPAALPGPLRSSAHFRGPSLQPPTSGLADEGRMRFFSCGDPEEEPELERLRLRLLHRNTIENLTNFEPLGM